MSEEIRHFQNKILNEKVRDKIKELLPDSIQQQIFISSLYDIAVNEYVKTTDIKDIKDILAEKKEKINCTIFKTLYNLEIKN